MAFAIFYEIEDLQRMATQLADASLPAKLRGDINKYWNGGFNGWATAPYGWRPGDTYEHERRTHYLIITYGTLAEFRQLLVDVANALGTDAAKVLISFAADMGRFCGGCDPYPPV